MKWELPCVCYIDNVLSRNNCSSQIFTKLVMYYEVENIVVVS